MKKRLQKLLSLGVISALVLSLVLPTNVAFADEVSTESEAVVTANEESYVETVSESEKAAAEKTEGETDESKKEDSEKIEEANDKKVEEKADESKKEDSEKIEEADNKKVEEQTDESKKEESEEIEKTDDKKTEEKATKTESKKQDSEELEESEEIEDEDELEEEIEEDIEAVLGETLSSLTVTDKSGVMKNGDFPLGADTIVTGDVYVQGGMLILNGHTLEVQGDVIVTDGWLWVSDSSKLVVHGKLQMSGGKISIDEEGKAEVDGNLELQTDDGNIGSSNFSNNGSCVVGGDVIVNTRGSFMYSYAAGGYLYIGGNYIDKVGKYYSGTVFFTGNRMHILDMTESSAIERLQPNGNGISVTKFFNVKNLLGDVALSTQKSEIITATGINMSQGSLLTVPCTYITYDRVIMEKGSILNVDSDWLCPSGVVDIYGGACANIKGNLKIESTDSDNQPIMGTCKLNITGYCNVDGDFVINTTGEVIDIWSAHAKTGRLSLKGNYIDKVGKHFRATVVMETKGKTIKTSGEKIDILYLAGNRNEYNIITPNCWNTIYEVSVGWKLDKTGWWYQNIDGTCPRSTWKLIDGKWYHFNANGYMQTGWIQDGSNWYYLESNGVMATSKWIDNTFYVKSNGVMAVNEWIDDKYYVDNTGRWVPGKQKPGWKQDKTGWWYQNADGTYPRSCWKEIGGKWYHFNASGYMQTGWIMDGTVWYYLEANGAMATNKWIEELFYVKANGAMAVSEWVDGGKYYVDATGRWVPNKAK